MSTSLPGSSVLSKKLKPKKEKRKQKHIYPHVSVRRHVPTALRQWDDITYTRHPTYTLGASPAASPPAPLPDLRASHGVRFSRRGGSFRWRCGKRPGGGVRGNAFTLTWSWKVSRARVHLHPPLYIHRQGQHRQHHRRFHSGKLRRCHHRSPSCVDLGHLRAFLV